MTLCPLGQAVQCYCAKQVNSFAAAGPSQKTAVLLLAHGSPENPGQVPEFLSYVTGGRPLPAAVVEEIRHRYSLISFSPLPCWTLLQADQLAQLLQMPVFVGMRNWRPFIADAVKAIASGRYDRVIAICLAPQNSRTSVGLYRSAVVGDGNLPFKMDFVEEWHDHPLLAKAFAENLRAGWEKACAESGTKLPVIFTAHSVPQRTITEGDPYERQAKETAQLVAKEASLGAGDWTFAFQSQGMSGGAWIGPTVEDTIRNLKAKGHRGVFLDPIGFVCDHVEVLYDIDIAFKEFAEKEGMRLWRAESLNGSKTLTAALAEVARSRLMAPGLQLGARSRSQKLHSMKRIAIIGGGISGLSAAYAIEEKRRSGAPVEYVLFESSPRLGGVLVTDRVDGCLVEAGPDSFLTEKPWAADLCGKIGLGDQLIGSNDSERKTYIVVRGKLVVMPDGLMFMVPTKIMPTVFSPLFSWRTKMRMAAEWFHPPRVHPPNQASADESVAEMVERHYGAEMVDLLADPLLSGVYGGEASQLSVRAVLARFADMEAKYGSLGRAMLAARKKMGAAANAPARPLFTSLKDGMQQMVDALVARLDVNALKTSSPVQSVIPQESGWTVSAGYQSDHFDAVIVATPTHAAAAVLQAADENLSHDLGEIKYSSSVTVTLGYDEKVRRSLPPGFGFLVPRSAGHRMLAATFVHNKFPHRAPENRAIVRCFLGGARDEQILETSEEEILEIVRNELRQIIALDAEPLFARLYKWKSAMAQYSVGHLERLQRIESLRQKLPGLALAGNGYNGIGVPDCVRSGAEAATKILAEMGMWSAA